MEVAESAIETVTTIQSERATENIYIGIDAPRVPLPSTRMWSWNGKKQTWIRQTMQRGRHCEVVIKALNVANPQWTPQIESSPEWMLVGYALFEQLAKTGRVYEVFPTASYRLLAEDTDSFVRINFAEFAGGPKDMIDACIAAYTVLEFHKGIGCEVGGGDGLGTIVLPRRPCHPYFETVMNYPTS